MTRVLLAEGELNWTKAERITDRYGAVHIQTGGEAPRSQEDLLLDLPGEYASFASAPVGALGRLVAEVTIRSDSYHVGDSFRGVTPTTPNVGDQIAMGEGELFVEVQEDIPTIGVRPDDHRESEWMNPEALYNLHAQTVKLYFESESEV